MGPPGRVDVPRACAVIACCPILSRALDRAGTLVYRIARFPADRFGRFGHSTRSSIRVEIRPGWKLPVRQSRHREDIERAAGLHDESLGALVPAPQAAKCRHRVLQLVEEVRLLAGMRKAGRLLR